MDTQITPVEALRELVDALHGTNSRRYSPWPATRAGGPPPPVLPTPVKEALARAEAALAR